MQLSSYPALFRSADALSARSQRFFYTFLAWHLLCLVVAAVLSVLGIKHWFFAVVQVISLLGSLACSLYLFGRRPDRIWYASRALAESIKTMTWRFVCKAEPFNEETSVCRMDFQRRLQDAVRQNKEIAQSMTECLSESHVTSDMLQFRERPLIDRQAFYLEFRVRDQLKWYASKSRFNRVASNRFFAGLVVVNALALLVSVLRIKFVGASYWPTDVFVAVAASLLAWMQAKRYSELAASYALAATEIGIIRDRALQSKTDSEFSIFVGDAENAFSREHTQWIARQDS